MEAGGAGAAALGLAACGDDYFAAKTKHKSDAPNTLLIVTDSTRADYIGAYNRVSRNKTPNLDALARDSLLFDLAVPEAMPTGPARRALLTGQRSFPYRNWVPTQGLPLEPGWIPIPDGQPIVTEVMGEAGVETAYCTDNPFLVGPRFGNFRRTLDCRPPELLPGRVPLPEQAVQAPGPPERHRALPAAQAEQLPGGGPPALARGVEQHLPAHRAPVPGGAGHAQRDKPPGRPQEAAALLPRRGQLRSTRAAGCPHRLRGPVRHRPARHREAGHRAHPALRDPVLVGGGGGPRRRDDRGGPRSLRRRDHLRGRLDRPADEQAGRREAAGRDRRLLHLRSRPDAGRGRCGGQGGGPGPVAHLPRALHDPAPRGQARGRAQRLLRLHPRRGAHPPLLHGHPRARDR